MIVLQDIWWLLVLIGVMILIHELGHYWAARLFDVRVDTFSFGFGPRLFGFRKGETDFRFSLVLFGGYVKMAGQDPGDENATDPRSFLAKPRWQRLIVLFAGPFMNVVLGVVLLACVYMVHFEKLPNNPDPVIGYLVPDGAAAKAGLHEGDKIVQIDNIVDPTWEDVSMREAMTAGHQLDVWVLRDGARSHFTFSPVMDNHTGAGIAGWAESTDIEIVSVLPDMDAARAGLQKGDILISVNGQPIRSTYKLHDLINQTGGKPLTLAYIRNGHQHQVSVTPERKKMDGTEQMMIGVSLEPKLVIIQLPLPEALLESVRQNAKYAEFLYTTLRGIVQQKMSPRSLTSPIGIAQLSGEYARAGTIPFLGLMAMVSMNLAVFNLLPIPILDGGTILLLFIEMFMRRDLSLRVKEAVFKVGFVFLMAVVAFAIYNDISKLTG